MARYRKIDTRMWGDVKFRELSSPAPSAKYLWIFLLTGPHTTNLPGLFRAGEMSLAEELGWPVETFRERFAELSGAGLAKADWNARVVWIPNAVKYNRPDNPNVVKSWRDSWDEVPECPLKSEAYERLKGFMGGLGEGFTGTFRQGCGHGLANQEQELELEQEHLTPTKSGAQNLEPKKQSQDTEQGTPHGLPAETLAHKVIEVFSLSNMPNVLRAVAAAIKAMAGEKKCGTAEGCDALIEVSTRAQAAGKPINYLWFMNTGWREWEAKQAKAAEPKKRPTTPEEQMAEQREEGRRMRAEKATRKVGNGN